MTLPGETIATGAPYDGRCPDCKQPMPIGVHQSNAGYYIGTVCLSCGPYSRESGYYPTREKAEAALAVGGYQRTTEFTGGGSIGMWNDRSTLPKVISALEAAADLLDKEGE